MQMTWAKERHWCLPDISPLLYSAHDTCSTVLSMQCVLSAPSLLSLLGTTVSGQDVLPTAVPLAVASAAVKACIGNRELLESMVLRHASFGVLALDTAEPVVLQVCTDLAAAQLQVFGASNHVTLTAELGRTVKSDSSPRSKQASVKPAASNVLRSIIQQRVVQTAGPTLAKVDLAAVALTEPDIATCCTVESSLGAGPWANGSLGSTLAAVDACSLTLLDSQDSTDVTVSKRSLTVLSTNGPVLQLVGLNYRPVSSLLSGHRGVVTSDEHFMYATEWFAEKPFGALDNAFMTSRKTLLANAHQETSSCFQEVAQAMMLLQQSAVGNVKALQLRTPFAPALQHPCLGSTALCGSFGSLPPAMMRSAVHEMRGVHLSAVSGADATASWALDTADSVVTDGIYAPSVASGVHYAARLVRSSAAAAESVGDVSGCALQLPKKGCYIVTGGSGFVGVQIAAWLSSQAVQHIVLVSRSGRLPPELALLANRLGDDSNNIVSITAAKADSAFLEDRKYVFGQSSWSRELPILGVCHASGVLADATVANQSLASIRKVTAPKASNTGYWQHLVQALPTASQVMFSSVAALLGSPGQANYSAANAALDASALNWSMQGIPCASIQYGAWSGAGMASNDAQTAARIQRLGISLLAPQQGLDALQACMQQLLPAYAVGNLAPSHAVMAAVPFKWSAFLPRQPDAFFDLMRQTSGPGAARPAAVSFSSVPKSIALVDTAQVKERVQTAVQLILGQQILDDQPLMEAGLDSLGSVELRNALQESLNVQLNDTLVFDYPTVDALAAHLSTKLAPAVADGNTGTYMASFSASGFEGPVSRPLKLHSSTSAAGLLCIDAVVVNAGCNGAAQRSDIHDPVTVVPLSRWDVESPPSQVIEICATLILVVVVTCGTMDMPMSHEPTPISHSLHDLCHFKVGLSFAVICCH